MQRYLALAVLLEEMAAALQVQRCIWGVDDNEAAQTAALLVNRSLAQREGNSESIRLHDLQLDYVRAQFPNKEALELIHGAVRLSSNVIERNPDQFASQMVGRLLPHQRNHAIEDFTRKVGGGAQTPWLEPLHPALHPPGTALLRTLSGHSDRVRAVAVTPDGQHAISASEDNTLKVWELSNGRELRTLSGHLGIVHALALTPDGQRAVLASYDGYLTVWDLVSGRQLRTDTVHSKMVTSVAVTLDGQRAISASWDQTLKVWDLDSGRELRSLIGHSGGVTAVAVTQDGERAISSSSDNTVKMWRLETGEVLATFTCDGAAYCCAFSDALELIVAGDSVGHVHFLHVQEPKRKLGPPGAHAR